MEFNGARKVLLSHLVGGDMRPGAEPHIRIDQTLTQDATDTMVILEFEGLVREAPAIFVINILGR